MDRSINVRSRIGLTCMVLVVTTLLAACIPASISRTPAPPTSAPTAAAPTATPPTQASPTPVLAAMDVTEEVFASPNGEWTATVTTAMPGQAGGESYYARLTVARVGGGTEWVAVEEWRGTGLGWTNPRPLQWTPDGSALYFTNLPHPDGCSVLVNGTDLHRLDLATGEVTELLPESALWVALSPAEDQVAYIAYGQRGLVVHDLATGAEQAFAPTLVPQPAQSGAIVWSPDASRLAYTIVHDPCGVEPGSRTIAVLDPASGETTTTVIDDIAGVQTLAWPEAGRVRLTSPEGDYWLDLDTGEVEAVAAN